MQAHARQESSTEPNRLIHEKSLYLNQHAHNPVDWYPWSEEALQRARDEDKPILLSIGYSACHWCHVMAHESFEDLETAEIMNRFFINIKVDREERPDLDDIYMAAVVAMRGHGGWPMTIFLTPDGAPFFGGTYFPPEDKAARYGMVGFKTILHEIVKAYYTRRNEILDAGQRIVEHIQHYHNKLAESDQQPLSNSLLDAALTSLQRDFDPSYGGFGTAPKFPQPMTLEFLLRSHVRTGNEIAMHMLETTLQRMACGGIYDHVGGGFHRYSVDERWLVPHFEKMLYDNALLARLYTETFQHTNNPFYRRIAEETLDYVVREMYHPQGGFYSTQDADSEGKEGAFFTWNLDEIRQVLGEDAALFCQVFGITDAGNFEGTNIIHIARPIDDIAQGTGTAPHELQKLIDRSIHKLRGVREARIKPGRDEKVITAWNGMMLRSFATAAIAFGRADYLEIAQKNASFLLNFLCQSNGRVLRTWFDTPTHDDTATTTPPRPPGTLSSSSPGYLEDYALLADGLIALSHADGNPHWLNEAIRLADSMLALFWDKRENRFYDTASDHEELILRPRNVSDNATPSGNSVAVDILLRLAALTGNDTYWKCAEQVLTSFATSLQNVPAAFGRLLCAADFALAPVREVALVGNPESPDMQELMAIVQRPYRPNIVAAYRMVGDTPPHDMAEVDAIPLLKGRTMVNSKATAYVCQDFTCNQPITDAETLQQQLA
jgi:hypothetical protein